MYVCGSGGSPLFDLQWGAESFVLGPFFLGPKPCPTHYHNRPFEERPRGWGPCHRPKGRGGGIALWTRQREAVSGTQTCNGHAAQPGSSTNKGANTLRQLAMLPVMSRTLSRHPDNRVSLLPCRFAITRNGLRMRSVRHTEGRART